MSQRVEGVITNAGAGSRGGIDWDFTLDLCPWRADGGPLNRESVRIMIPMKSEAAAERTWLAWGKSEGATVALRLDRLELPSKSVPYTYGYGRLPVRRIKDDPEMKVVVREKAKQRKTTLKVPGLGVVTQSGDASHVSKPMRIPALGGHRCRIALEEYAGDASKEDFHVAVANMLSGDHSVLKAAEGHVFRYYKDCRDHGGAEDKGFPVIKSQRDVWAHVGFGGEFTVSRDEGDKRVYVSLECSCDWEVEHGLQLVFRNGLKITKVGPFDGHLTNSTAYDDKSLARVVYRARG